MPFLGARASRPLCQTAGLRRRTSGPRMRAGRPRSQAHNRCLVPAMPGWGEYICPLGKETAT